LHTKENKLLEKSDISQLVNLMIIDIKLEAGGEIVWSPEVEKAVRRKAGAKIGSLINKK